MKISEIKTYITPKTTGYTATAGLVLSVMSGVSKNRSFRKFHKPAAYATAAITALHIGLIEYNHYKWKKESKKQL